MNRKVKRKGAGRKNAVWWKRPVEMRYMVAMAAVFALMLVAVLLPSVMARPEEKRASLYIEEINPMLLEGDNSGHNLSKAVVRVAVYVTNSGNKDSGKLDVEGYARDSRSGLSYAVATWSCDTVKAGATEKAVLVLEMPVGYTYTIIIYGRIDSRLVLRSSGTISLKDTGGAAANPFDTGRRTSNYWNPYSPEEKDGAASGAKEYSLVSEEGASVAGGVVILIFVVVLAGVVYAAVSYSRKMEDSREAMESGEIKEEQSIAPVADEDNKNYENME